MKNRINLSVKIISGCSNSQPDISIDEPSKLEPDATAVDGGVNGFGYVTFQNRGKVVCGVSVDDASGHCRNDVGLNQVHHMSGIAKSFVAREVIGI